MVFCLQPSGELEVKTNVLTVTFRHQILVSLGIEKSSISGPTVNAHFTCADANGGIIMMVDLIATTGT